MFPQHTAILNLGYPAGTGTVTEWTSFDSRQNLSDYHSHTVLAGDLSDLWEVERNLVAGGMGVEKAHFKLKLLRNSPINGGSTWLRCEICFCTAFLFAH